MALAGFTVPVQDAVDTTLRADAPFAAWRGVTVDAADPRLYDGQAPAGTALWTSEDITIAAPWPYVAYGEMREDHVIALCQTDAAAFDIPWDLRVWVPGANHRLAREGYGHVRRILHDRTWSLSGAVLTATVTLLRTLTVPDGPGFATQAIARVSLTARPA